MFNKRTFNTNDVIGANLVVHANCLDGAGSEILWRLAGGNKRNIHRVAAGEFDKFYKEKWQELDAHPLLLCDIAPRQEQTWYDLSLRTFSTMVLDHHITSEKFNREPYSLFFEFSLDKCGTLMMWDFLSKIFQGWTDDMKGYKSLVDSINRHDLWLPEMNEFDHDLAILMKTQGHEEFALNKSISPRISLEENTVIHYEKKRLERMTNRILDNTRIVSYPKYPGLKFGCVVVSEDISSVLNEMLSRFNSVDIAMGVSHEDGSVSLRSRRGGPDCSIIAGDHGGGGHVRAAGFKVSHKVISSIFEDVI